MADDTGTTVVELISRISNRLRQSMGAAMDSADLGGLTMHQARMVGFIEAEEHRGVIARDIAELAGTRPASVSGVLTGLEQDGWIERRVDPADSRRKTLHVTQKARTMLADFWRRPWAGAEAQVVAALSADELTALVALLARLDERLSPGSPGS